MLLLFACALPICFWAAWSDLTRMKIPNRAVLALAGVFALAGPLVLPLPDWGLRWLHLAVVLAAGFLLTLAGQVGAGDAKFAAAMAPFVAASDTAAFLVLFALVLIASFVLHRGARRLPGLRRRLAGWESWRREDFPMGLALGATLALYLGQAAL